MEQKRDSSDKQSRGRSVLILIALLGLVPVFSIVAFFGASESDRGSGQRPQIASSPLERSLHEEATQERTPSQYGQKRLADSAAIQDPTRNPPPGGPAFPLELQMVPDRGASTSPSAAEEDAARFRRFDENARVFDERLSIFEREKGNIDDGATAAIQERLLSALVPLHPEIKVNARCASSVCVVEVSSDAPVGTMIARISPWLRKNTSLATGDPADVEDQHSLRLAFDKFDLPEDF